MVAAMARSTGQPLLIWLSSTKPINKPQNRIVRDFLRPMRSESQPPPGRATKLVKAKADASNPAVTGVTSLNVSRKNNGSMEFTASSEPNVMK